MSVLIWVQIVCNGYQQMTKVAASKARVNLSDIYSTKKVKEIVFEGL